MAESDNHILVNREELHQLRAEVTDIKIFIRQMADALTRLTILEERQQNVTATTNQILTQIDMIRGHQQAVALQTAREGDVPARFEAIDRVLSAMTIERAEEKARVGTVSNLVRAAWAVISVSGVAGILTITKAFTVFTGSP